MTSEKRFARLLEAIGRQARAQERRGRISPPKVTRARHRGPTRQELQAAMAWADGYLLQHGRLSPAARSALQGAVARRAMRQPKGDFSYRQPTQPTADQLAVLDQLYEGQRRAYLAEHPIRGAQGNYEPSGLKEEVGTALAALGFLAEPLGAPLAGVGVRLQVADIRRQLLDLSYVPSVPPDPVPSSLGGMRRPWPWNLLADAEIADVQRRLYGPGGLAAERMAAGY
jgi:hypothetical protein